MTPAKISNLDPVQVTGYRLPEPNKKEYFNVFLPFNEAASRVIQYSKDMAEYESSKFIADVENARKTPDKIMEDMGEIFWPAYVKIGETFEGLSLNQKVFIEPTTEGKVKIVKLN